MYLGVFAVASFRIAPAAAKIIAAMEQIAITEKSSKKQIILLILI